MHGRLAQRLRELGKPRARRRRRQDPQHKLAGARHAQRRTEARLVVLVGDLEAALVLLLVGVLAETVVIEAQVHGLRVGRPHPHRDGGRVALCAADVELRRMALPEIADSEGDAARGSAEVAETAGARAALRCRARRGHRRCACGW